LGHDPGRASKAAIPPGQTAEASFLRGPGLRAKIFSPGKVIDSGSSLLYNVNRIIALPVKEGLS
jgi:hypothetical protein